MILLIKIYLFLTFLKRFIQLVLFVHCMSLKPVSVMEKTNSMLNIIKYVIRKQLSVILHPQSSIKTLSYFISNIFRDLLNVCTLQSD